MYNPSHQLPITIPLCNAFTSPETIYILPYFPPSFTLFPTIDDNNILSPSVMNCLLPSYSSFLGNVPIFEH
jgi:hypothetical protein